MVDLIAEASLHPLYAQLLLGDVGPGVTDKLPAQLDAAFVHLICDVMRRHGACNQPIETQYEYWREFLLSLSELIWWEKHQM